MMDYLQRAANFVLRRAEKPLPPPPQDEEMTKLDAYVNLACKVISWEDATLTWISFLCLNLLYSLIIYYETRFYCIVFSTAALFVVLDYYDDAIKFKNLRRYLRVSDVTAWCSTFMYNMHCWKRDNPSLFCGVMTTFFLTLSFIGRTISGRVLAYFVLLGVYFGPALVKLAPKEVQKSFWDFVKVVRSPEIVNEQELLPLITENYDDDKDDETRTQDSFTSSLISGISSMPSHLDADAGLPGLQEDDLLPSERIRQRASAVADFSSDSSDSDMDLDQADGMHFDSKHFTGNSSSGSEDEHRYEKGLRFSDVRDASVLGAQSPQSFAGGMVSSLAAVGSNLLSNLHSNFASQHTTKERTATMRRDSSDNSDFEIIDKDDSDAGGDT